MPSNGDPEKAMAAALRHERRRHLIRYLRARGGAATLTALAARIAAETGSDFPSAMATLQDLHLPRLTECGLVEQDAETGAVRLAADPERVDRALERVET